MLRKQIHFFAHFVGEVGEEQAVVRRCSVKKVFLDLSVLRQPEACNFIIKETLAQVFSCEFCEISKNTFLLHLWATASISFKNLSLECAKYFLAYAIIILLNSVNVIKTDLFDIG